MRKIERQMCDAVQGNRNWSSANTSVTIDKETNTSSVYLHGNLIATVTDNDMTIYDGGWQSNTTKSRINALCDAFCVSGEGIFQKISPGMKESLSVQLTDNLSSLPKLSNLVMSLPDVITEGFHTVSPL